MSGWKALTQEWRDHYEVNHASKHEEYYRLWRGQWAEQDKMRQSERSKLIAPALQQAVESSVAEIETASFSQSFMFDIVDDEETPQAPPGSPHHPLLPKGNHSNNLAWPLRPRVRVVVLTSKKPHR